MWLDNSQLQVHLPCYHFVYTFHCKFVGGTMQYRKSADGKVDKIQTALPVTCPSGYKWKESCTPPTAYSAPQHGSRSSQRSQPDWSRVHPAGRWASDFSPPRSAWCSAICDAYPPKLFMSQSTTQNRFWPWTPQPMQVYIRGNKNNLLTSYNMDYLIMHVLIIPSFVFSKHFLSQV